MIIVFDIDSTLADITHRLHYIKQTPKNWNAFFNACERDLPIIPMVELYRKLEQDNICYLLTGRTEATRTMTEDWLFDHTIKYYDLLMRKNKDFRPDYVVKREMVAMLIARHGHIDLAVDDSPEVVKMYRELGIFTLDANQGERQ